MFVAQSVPCQSSIMELHNFGFKMIKRCSPFRVYDRALQYVIKTGVIEIFHLSFLSSLHRPFSDEALLSFPRVRSGAAVCHKDRRNRDFPSEFPLVASPSLLG